MEDDALQDDEPVEDTKAAPAGTAPNSWLGLIFAFTALAIGATMAVLLVSQFLSTRPIDLKEHSREVSEALEDLLVSNRVVPTIEGPTLVQTDAAHYNFSRYIIELPPSLDDVGLEAVIERDMRGRMVTVETLYKGGVKAGLFLAFGDYVFAEVVLRSIGPSGEAPAAVSQMKAVVEPEPISERQSDDPAPETSVPDPAADEPEAERPREAGPDQPPAEIAKVPTPMPQPVPPVPRPPPPTSVTQSVARLAIIIDDGGYGSGVTEDILALSPGLTLAILPYTPFAEQTARRADELGFEVLLHMPMQSLTEGARFDGQLDTGMSKEEIHRLTGQALAEVPFAAGVNNHTGSRFTADTEGMKMFLDGLAERGLFFIDSRTSDQTKGERLARAANVRTASRDVFLDNVPERGAILEQLSIAANLAIKNGEVVAICHFHSNTASALAEFLPTLERDGIELVHASELVH